MEAITTTELLEALREPGNEEVWREFDARFRPIVWGMARRMGLSEADASDVAQESLLEFFRDYRSERYARERGRLRSWLFGITRHRVRDALRRQAEKRFVRGDSLIDELPSDSELEHSWEAEISAVVSRRAVDVLRRSSDVDERSIAVFEQYGLQQRSVEDVAAEFEVSTATVYSIKSRCLKRLQVYRAEILTDLFDS